MSSSTPHSKKRRASPIAGVASASLDGWPIDAESRMFMVSIVQSSDDAIIGKTLEATITTWNPGAERMYGYTAGDDGAGASAASASSPADRTISR